MKTSLKALVALLAIVVPMIGSSCTVAVPGAAGSPGAHQQTAGQALAAGADERIARKELAASAQAQALPDLAGRALAEGADQRIARQELAAVPLTLASTGSAENGSANMLGLAGTSETFPATIPLPTAQASQSLPFHAHFPALTFKATPCGNNLYCVTVTGPGTATHLGNTTVSISAIVDFTTNPTGCGIITATQALVAANGDKLFTTVTSGTSCPTSSGRISTLPWVFTGGTGRFTGATGGGIQTQVETNGSSTFPADWVGNIAIERVGEP